jgi:hypothetical protein
MPGSHCICDILRCGGPKICTNAKSSKLLMELAFDAEPGFDKTKQRNPDANHGSGCAVRYKCREIQRVAPTTLIPISPCHGQDVWNVAISRGLKLDRRSNTREALRLIRLVALI